MSRKTKAEPRARISRGAEDGAKELAQKIARWAIDNLAALDGDGEPALPDVLHDRAADNWRPLFVIAEAMGPSVGASVKDACLALSGIEEGSDDDENRLPQMALSDMREIMLARGEDRISTSILLQSMWAMEARPWDAYNHGRPLNAWGLSKLLGGFGIHSKTIKLPDGKTAKGFPQTGCLDAWTRYLPEEDANLDTLMERAAAAAEAEGMF